MSVFLLPLFAGGEEPIYGVYSLPNYEVDGSANDRSFKGWDFNSVTMAEEAGRRA